MQSTANAAKSEMINDKQISKFTFYMTTDSSIPFWHMNPKHTSEVGEKRSQNYKCV